MLYVIYYILYIYIIYSIYYRYYIYCRCYIYYMSLVLSNDCAGVAPVEPLRSVQGRSKVGPRSAPGRFQVGQGGLRSTVYGQGWCLGGGPRKMWIFGLILL